MENNLINEDYRDFIGKIKNKIRNSQYEAMRAVNKTLINLYWGIGQEIYNQQQEKGWGKSIVELLAKELKKKNFQMFKVFLQEIYGECEIYMLNIKIMKFCHH